MFSFLKRGAAVPGLTAIGLQADGMCIARVDWPAGQRPRLVHSEYQPWEQDSAPERQLQKLAAQQHLKSARCTTLLDESEYTLVLTEAPDVRPDELKTALRWKVKDLIDFHINDATLDAFALPGEDGGRVREMYAVAARNEAIRRRVDQLQDAGVNLDIIDIPEMAQRNLAALLPEDARGVAVLSFGAKGGLLTISRQGELYLSRSLDVGLDHLLASGGLTGYYDRVVLEAQRSLDYYESHFRMTPVQQLTLTPIGNRMPELLDYLRANLSVAVGVMNLAEMIDLDTGVPPELEGPCLFMLGAALRREEKAL
jgi:MSHA biogenesis protein MshI